MDEDIITILCRDQQDAEAEKIKWETVLAGEPYDIHVRKVSGLPVMSPVSFGEKPVVFSIRISDAWNDSWVVTVQKR